MYEKKVEFILRNISILTLIIFYYPVFVIFRLYRFHLDELWMGLGMAFVYLYIGYFIAFLTQKRVVSERTGFAAYFNIYVPIIISMLIFIMPNYYISDVTGILSNKERLLFEAVVAAVFYIIGVKSFFSDCYDIINGKSIIKGTILLSMCILITNFSKGYAFLKSPFLIGEFIALLITLIMMNQRTIEDVIIQKSAKNMIPKNIRIYNVMLVTIVFVLMLTLYYFRSVLNILVWLAQYCLYMIFKGFIYLSSLVDFGFSKRIAPAAIQFQEQPGNYGQQSIYSQIAIGLFSVFLVTVFLSLLPRISRMLMNFIKGCVYLIQNMFQIQVRREKSKEYEDVDESFDSVEKKSRQKDLNREINLLYSKMRHIKDPILRVRNFYSLMLHILRKYHYEVNDSDTPGQIMTNVLKAKALKKSISINEDMIDITNRYNDVRYGEIMPSTNEMNQFENKMEKVQKAIKHNE